MGVTILDAGERGVVEQVDVARLALAAVFEKAVALDALSRAAVDGHAGCTETNA